MYYLARLLFDSMPSSLILLLTSIYALFIEKLRAWYRKKKPKERLLEQLSQAKTYEQWQDTATKLDAELGNDLWRHDPTSTDYDYQFIRDCLRRLKEARKDGDIVRLVNLVRSGLLRNLGNISHINLFNRSYAGSKYLIAKLDLFHDTRQSFGRSTLVLQGGAMFGLYHLGIVKGLHLRGLLPRIITGTGVGALIAALVGIHPEEELIRFLAVDGIDLNVKVLEECVRANVGDLTFDEAYQKTKRILNITVSTAKRNGVPKLLNYLTAPNVLIWSAACASNATSTLYDSVELMCKDENGAIVPWVDQEITWQRWTQASNADRDSPQTRIAELFNVNHFIVSQARPYLAPFLMSDLHRHGRHGITLKIVHLLGLEIRHRLSQLDLLGFLPFGLRTFLVDETIPGASVTVVPHLRLADFEQLLQNPDKQTVKYWIEKGERSIWPAGELLKARCEIEFTLDILYLNVRDDLQVYRGGVECLDKGTGTSRMEVRQRAVNESNGIAGHNRRLSS
ncbi:uncharacterized protein H6S33_000832 [Morchella sextelata]|uniref:uncharacterized protein n=1 Tax=Morchella sextelata TaxID=1174677 RepID=UPI001D0503CF|nr:uncharacterized protein H6S33_000832 [Morchella sextelata]KAH0615196.1 hypothetical protein H6S33_000832 [Morchella sextelata]